MKCSNIYFHHFISFETLAMRPDWQAVLFKSRDRRSCPFKLLLLVPKTVLKLSKEKFLLFSNSPKSIVMDLRSHLSMPFLCGSSDLPASHSLQGCPEVLLLPSPIWRTVFLYAGMLGSDWSVSLLISQHRVRCLSQHLKYSLQITGIWMDKGTDKNIKDFLHQREKTVWILICYAPHGPAIKMYAPSISRKMHKKAHLMTGFQSNFLKRSY